MNSFTVDQIMKWDPCDTYPRKRIEELWAGRESLTRREIAALDIPRQDVWWTLNRGASEAQRIHLFKTSAYNVASDDAWNAAWDEKNTAWGTAWNAAWDAAWKASWNKQIEYAINYLEGEAT